MGQAEPHEWEPIAFPTPEFNFWDFAAFYTADWNSIKLSAAYAFTWQESSIIGGSFSPGFCDFDFGPFSNCFGDSSTLNELEAASDRRQHHAQAVRSRYLRPVAG